MTEKRTHHNLMQLRVPAEPAPGSGGAAPPDVCLLQPFQRSGLSAQQPEEPEEPDFPTEALSQ